MTDGKKNAEVMSAGRRTPIFSTAARARPPPPWIPPSQTLIPRRNTIFSGKKRSEICNSILAALSSQGRLKPATKLLQKMLRLRFSPTTLAFGVFLWNFSKFANLPTVFTCIDSLNGYSAEINGSVLATLIADGLCHASRPSDASLALEELRTRGLKPDFMAYRVVAEALRSIGKITEAEAVLKRKRKLGVAPREGDYSDLIQKFISEMMFMEAKYIGEVIVGGNFPIDSHLLDSLTGFISFDYPDSAVAFLRCLVEKGGVPSMSTLWSFCRGACRKGKERELVRELSSGRLFRGESEGYVVVVSCLCEEGRVREAYDVMLEMKKGKGGDLRCYNSVMEACCREEMMGPAKKLWDEMVANGCSPNLYSYKILIWKMSEMGEAEGAWRLLQRMEEGVVAPDDDIYIWVAQGLAMEGDIGAAACVLSNGCVRPRVWHAVVLRLCLEGEMAGAGQLLRSGRSNGKGMAGPDNWEAHAVLLKHMNPSAAVEHIEWLKRNGAVFPLHAVFSELVASLASASDSESTRLKLLVEKMMEKTCVDFQSDLRRQLWEKAFHSI